jgi:hypothetical protein
MILFKVELWPRRGSISRYLHGYTQITKTLCILIVSEFATGVIEAGNRLCCVIDLLRTRGLVG